MRLAAYATAVALLATSAAQIQLRAAQVPHVAPPVKGTGKSHSRPDRYPENAAVKYLRADAALRQSYALPPDAVKKLEKALAAPLDAEDEKLVAAADEALVEFHHGASIQNCHWDLSIEDAPSTNTSHRGAIRELVAVAGLRARLRFRDGNADGAISDAVAALAAARHLSTDGTLASVLYDYMLERSIFNLLTPSLQRLTPVQLAHLSTELNTVPSGSTLGTALQSEKVSRSDLRMIVHGAKDRDEIIARLSAVPAMRSNQALATEIVDGCGGGAAGVSRCIEQQEAFYRTVAHQFGSPAQQFEKWYSGEFDALSRKNPIIRTFTPALPRFRWTDAYAATRRALLSAAIAVQSGGPKLLAQHRDPYDGKPFSYVAVEHGFRLESNLKENGSPLSISDTPEPSDGRPEGK
jgi:hypothetical protein